MRRLEGIIARAVVALLALGTLASCGDNKVIDARPIVIDASPDAPPDAAPDAALADCVPTPGTRPVRKLYATVADLPTIVTAPVGDRRLFATEQSGAIRVIVDGQVLPTPFLDLGPNGGGPVVSGGELGLLGLAFHPKYAENRRFYVYYTIAINGRWAEELVEFQAMADDPNRADPATMRTLLDMPDIKSNHQGGMLAFGADGYLYISTGDGGGQGDPEENAQDRAKLFGKILRIDVDTRYRDLPYGIPPRNPFANGGGAPEVFMYGFRNPWRFSIDSATGDFYVGDVGGAVIEEIDVIPAAIARGADLGWDDCEGTTNFEGTGCDAPTQPNRIKPVVEHNHAVIPSFQAIIGGVVYHGRCYPDVDGRYFYTDFYAGGLYSFVYKDGVATDQQVVPRLSGFPTVVSSLYVDGFGEMYLTYRDGTIYKLTFE